MKWIAGILIALEMGVFSHYGVAEPTVMPKEIKQAKATRGEPFVALGTLKEKVQDRDKGYTEPVALFAIDEELLSGMKRGEILTLNGIEHHTYRLKIREKHYFKNHITIQMQCLQESSPCTASVTIGSTLTSMHLVTLQGVYEMESNHDIAYFYKQP